MEGRPAVLTDSAGRSRFESVSVPYAAVLVLELGQRARVYRDLTRLDPVFLVEGPVGSRGASLEGTTSGGVGFPLPPDHDTFYAYSTTPSRDVQLGSISTTTGDGSVPILRWSGTASTHVPFFVLQAHRNASWLVDDFTGMAALDVPVTDGDSLSGLGFALGAVHTALVGGTVDVPSATVLTSPNDGAVGLLHETVFTVSPDADRIYGFRWTPQGLGPEIELFTNDPVATPPDLTPYGLPVPSGESYSWRCQAFGPGLTVDEYACGAGETALDGGDGFVNFTTTRPFTTGP